MTLFQNVTNIGDKLQITSLEDNLKSFLDWGFLNIGGFVNVKTSVVGIDGGDFSTLKPAKDPTISDNTVWETNRKDWVPETGVSHSGISTVSISGVYLSGTLIPSPTGNSTLPYRINYPLGQIILSSPKAANTSLSINYSYRYVQVYKSSESTWWHEIQKYSYSPSNSNANDIHRITANHRIQLPAIVIEIIPRTIQTPYQLGTSRNIIIQDVLLHIFAENITQRNTIIDILLLQKDKQTYLYDIQKIITAGVFKLNYRGEINNNGLNYGQLITNSIYQSNTVYISNATTSEFNTISSTLHNAIIRWTIEILP